ncbi:MAG: hypothetical protein MI702_15020 [Chlorobiales bacterium]|nr:hypothetical protein [Chlorobiales bacterium]
MSVHKGGDPLHPVFRESVSKSLLLVRPRNPISTLMSEVPYPEERYE